MRYLVNLNPGVIHAKLIKTLTNDNEFSSCSVGVFMTTCEVQPRSRNRSFSIRSWCCVNYNQAHLIKIKESSEIWNPVTAVIRDSIATKFIRRWNDCPPG